ncbi:protein of unknown function [Candidatus Methylocalor cossyra]|uniref:Uncharacterized protein n=1 Tax=Candidatus Methylocalor cossyra TaxID=3108543 RepID=A0ABM9NJB9_9GAMM
MPDGAEEALVFIGTSLVGVKIYASQQKSAGVAPDRAAAFPVERCPERAVRDAFPL